MRLGLLRAAVSGMRVLQPIIDVDGRLTMSAPDVHFASIGLGDHLVISFTGAGAAALRDLTTEARRGRLDLRVGADPAALEGAIVETVKRLLIAADAAKIGLQVLERFDAEGARWLAARAPSPRTHFVPCALGPGRAVVRSGTGVVLSP